MKEQSGEWLTPFPSLLEGVTHRCEACCLYRDVVTALPPADRAQFACPCCPDYPCLSYYCYFTVGLPIPHVQSLWLGLWLVADRTRQLRSMLAPNEPPAGLCKAAISMNRSLLQMSREVEARKAAGIPVVPQSGGLAVPPLQSMTQ